MTKFTTIRMLTAKQAQEIIENMVNEREKNVPMWDGDIKCWFKEADEFQALQMALLLFKHVVVADEVLLKEM